jgi:hypothetical protein
MIDFQFSNCGRWAKPLRHYGDWINALGVEFIELDMVNNGFVLF